MGGAAMASLRSQRRVTYDFAYTPSAPLAPFLKYNSPVFAYP